jgi:hypothetical protein
MVTQARQPVQAWSTTALRPTGPDPVLSVVAPAYNEAECLPVFFDQIRTVMDALGETWELQQTAG